MKTKLILSVLAAGLVLVVMGCVKTVDGGSKAGWPGFKDQVEGRYNFTVQEVFDSAKKVLAANGTLNRENTINHSLEAKVNQSSVFVRVDGVDTNKPITYVVVQARGPGGGADADTAHEMEKQIALGLAATRVP
jgi:hypothetical protein